MSIVQLQEDLKQVASAIPKGPLVSTPELRDYLQHNLVPLLVATVGELEEMDGAIGDIVNQSEDVLHQENAELFMSLITSGLILVSELAKRVGNDKRLLAMIKEWKDVARQTESVLREITIPDDEDDGEAEEEAQSAGEVSADVSEDPSKEAPQ